MSDRCRPRVVRRPVEEPPAWWYVVLGVVVGVLLTGLLLLPVK